ncbi:hypothetical protein HYV31_00930 [candidate division WWE3 bacterium]|nr:hypothetical protein [candidate division WWE3 bacterium]
MVVATDRLDGIKQELSDLDRKDKETKEPLVDFEEIGKTIADFGDKVELKIALLQEKIAAAPEKWEKFLKGENDSRFPTHEKILEAKERAPHAVHLAISVELAKRAIEERYENFNLKTTETKLIKRDLRINGFKNQKRSATGPDIFVDNVLDAKEDVDGNTKEVHVVIRLNNNRSPNKSTVVVMTTKANPDGTLQFAQKQFDETGVYAVMTEKEYNQACKLDTLHSRWLRGEVTSETMTTKKEFPVVVGGKVVKKGLREYWENHDNHLDRSEKMEAGKKKEALLETTRYLQEVRDTKREALAEELTAYVSSMKETLEHFDINTINQEDQFIIAIANNTNEREMTIETIILAARKLGITSNMSRHRAEKILYESHAKRRAAIQKGSIPSHMFNEQVVKQNELKKQYEIKGERKRIRAQERLARQTRREELLVDLENEKKEIAERKRLEEEFQALLNKEPK